MEDETRLRGVLDAIFAFVGLFSPEGVVLDTNQAPLAAGHLERADVLGHRFVELPWFSHSEVERARVSDAIARAARGESSRFETSIVSRDGALVYIDAAFGPLRAESGAITHVVGTGVDVTVRRRAERELAESQAMLSEAQNVAHVGSWQWDVAKNRVTWSDELYRIYGVDRDKHVPSYEAFLSSVHEDDRAHTGAVLQKAMENVTPFVYDHRILRPDGSVRMLHTRGETLSDPTGRAARLVGSCWDITDRWEAMRRAESACEESEAARDQLRALTARLSEIREDERRDIARELHDQVGQALTALKIDLARVRARLGDGAPVEVVERLAGMNGLVDETLDTTRRISTSLRPAILDDVGLPAAVRWQAREFAQRCAIACDVQVPPEAEAGAAIPPATGLALFRILQEALTNVARHSGARQVRVGLELHGDAAILTIDDDGKGVEADVIDRSTSLGLIGMRERVLALGGKITISGETGRGTNVTVRAPLPPR